jgi:hypothetical protein
MRRRTWPADLAAAWLDQARRVRRVRLVSLPLVVLSGLGLLLAVLAGLGLLLVLVAVLAGLGRAPVAWHALWRLPRVLEARRDQDHQARVAGDPDFQKMFLD